MRGTDLQPRRRRPMGERRGVVRELLELMDQRGPQGVIRFAERHSIPEPNTGCWLAELATTASGYVAISDPRVLSNRRSQPRVFLHRLVCEAVYGPMGDLFTRHKCDNRACINPDHLEPGTHQDNSDDKWRRGRAAPTAGEANGRAILDHVKAAEIRKTYRRYVPGEAKAFSQKYGVAESIIRRVVSGELWNSAASPRSNAA